MKRTICILSILKVVGTVLLFMGVLPMQYFSWCTVFTIPYGLACFFEPLSRVRGITLLIALALDAVLWTLSILLLCVKKEVHSTQGAILILLNVSDCICILCSLFQGTAQDWSSFYPLSKLFALLYCVVLSSVIVAYAIHNRFPARIKLF